MGRTKTVGTFWVLGFIMLAILVWGIFHAIGAYRMNNNPWRGLVVACFSIGFILFWLLMLNNARSHRGRGG